MLNNDKVFNIKCPECEEFPFFNLNFINENILKIEYKCHNQNYQEISIDNFFQYFKYLINVKFVMKNQIVFVDYFVKIIIYSIHMKFLNY